MTTAATSTVIDQSSDAAFRTWIAEIITAFFTTVGMTQTADTGQINTATVTRPGAANTAAGYVIGRFNDSLQATSPIFFKLEFGTGATATTSPNFWITIGTGSNGSGTITGTTTTRVSLLGGAPASTSTAYTSRWCYNATDGAVAFAWKILGGVGGATGLGGFGIMRSSDNTGAPTATSYFALITVNTGAPTISGGNPSMYNFAAAAFQVVSNSGFWCWDPFTLTASLVGTTIYALPAGLFDASGMAFQAYLAGGFATEFPQGTSVVLALIGSTTHTFMPVPNIWGAVTPAGVPGINILIVWE